MNKIFTKVSATIYIILFMSSFFLINSYAKEKYNPKKECVWFENYNKLSVNGKIECLIKENINKGYILNPSLVTDLGSEGHKLLIKKAYEAINDPSRSLSILALLGHKSLPLEYYKKVFSIYNYKKHLTPYEHTFKNIAFNEIFEVDVYDIATPESYRNAIKLLHEVDLETQNSILTNMQYFGYGRDRKKVISFLHALYPDPIFGHDFVFAPLVRLKDTSVIPLLIDNLKNSVPQGRISAADWLATMAKSENAQETRGKITLPSANSVSSAKNVASIIPILEETIKTDQNPRVKIAIAGALSKLGDKRGVKEVIPLLKDNDPEIQRMSNEALTEITDKHYGDNPKAWNKWLEQYNRTQKKQKPVTMKPPAPVVVKSGFKEFKIASVKELYTTIYNQVPTSGPPYYEYHYTDKFIPFLPESFWKDNDQLSDEPIRMGYYLRTKGPEGKGDYVITILKGRKSAMMMLLKEKNGNYNKVWEQKLDACDFYNLLVKDLFDTKTEYKLKAPKDLNIVESCTINDQAKAMIYKWSDKGEIELLYFESGGANKKPVTTKEITSQIYPHDTSIPQGIEIGCFKHSCVVTSGQDKYWWYEGSFKSLPLPESISSTITNQLTLPGTIVDNVLKHKQGTQDYYVGGKPTF